MLPDGTEPAVKVRQSALHDDSRSGDLAGIAFFEDMPQLIYCKL
jgi:hypothetical protein